MCMIYQETTPLPHRPPGARALLSNDLWKERANNLPYHQCVCVYKKTTTMAVTINEEIDELHRRIALLGTSVSRS